MASVTNLEENSLFLSEPAASLVAFLGMKGVAMVTDQALHSATVCAAGGTTCVPSSRRPQLPPPEEPVECCKTR